MSVFALTVLATAACLLGGLAGVVLVAVSGAAYLAARVAAADPERAAGTARWVGYALRK